ncbi:MAG TPA: cation:proton antiporter, partial [Solirubrobacteraceae bacterium]|nr:cation:proton antiporter [Solirubrobacteraceae bacterium]
MGTRLTIHYVLLALVTAVVLIFVFGEGAGEHAQKQIGGSYDVTGVAPTLACLGPKIELAQSGRFVTLSNAQSTLGGSLTFKEGRLTGTVHCVVGGSRSIAARVAAGALAGTLGGLPVSAQLKKEPPEAGAPKPLAPTSVAGEYQLAPSSACLGSKIKLSQSDSVVQLVSAKVRRGTLAYEQGALTGAVLCKKGERLALAGTASGRTIELLTGALAGGAAGATAKPLERVSATKLRTAENTVVAFFIAVAIVMAFARLCGSVMPRLGQPRVMGEVLAGILLGPTAFGAIAPHLQATIFASDIIPYIGVAANLGLVFFMFLIGLEVDLGQMRGRTRMTFAVSNTALLIPFMLGLLVALPLYPLLAPEVRFAAFALFVGVSMSVTAFPVLARIVSERRMLKRPLGSLALSAAAVDD